MTAELTDPARSPDPGASAVHLLDVASATALIRRPGGDDLPASVGWGVLVLPVFGADPELSVEFTGRPAEGAEGSGDGDGNGNGDGDGNGDGEDPPADEAPSGP